MAFLIKPFATTVKAYLPSVPVNVLTLTRYCDVVIWVIASPSSETGTAGDDPVNDCRVRRKYCEASLNPLEPVNVTGAEKVIVRFCTARNLVAVTGSVSNVGSANTPLMLVTEGSEGIFVQVIWLAMPGAKDAANKLPVRSRIGVTASVVSSDSS